MINIISESRDGVITVFKVKVAQWLMTSVIAVTWARRPEQEKAVCDQGQRIRNYYSVGSASWTGEDQSQSLESLLVY